MHDVTPADCGLDFEGISSPQSPAITGRTITEGVEAQAQEKDQKDKTKRYSQRITSGKFLKKPKAVTLVETKK